MKLPKYEDPKIADAYLAKIVKEHINGKLMKDIEKEYNISHSTIYRYMKKHNIIFKNEHGRKNKFNQDYFETIDTEHKAYWLGFIYADGSVSNTGSGNTKTNRLTINISNKDIELLEAFCDDINISRDIIYTYEPKGTYSTNLMSKIYINSIKLCSDLAKLGVHPNKTGSLSSLPNISEEYIPHFIRGFFDGDGWCTCSDKTSNLGFVGDYDFLSEINNVLKNKANTSNRVLKDEPRREYQIFYLRYSSLKDYKLLYKYLYSDSTIYLNRKRLKVETLSKR